MSAVESNPAVDIDSVDTASTAGAARTTEPHLVDVIDLTGDEVELWIGAGRERKRAPASEPSSHRGYERAKRLLDIVGSALCLAAVAPALLTAMVAVRFTSRGPVIFRQTRVGKDGVPFTILKLRTMRIDADHQRQRELNVAELNGELEHLEDFSLDVDDRFTPVGRLLRKYSIDELPQLWNVARGDMSLVGPRPSCEWEMELVEPEFRVRLDVLPGITGLWQVAGRRTISMRGMLHLDCLYVRRRSLWLDLRILLRTIPVVIRGTGAA